jgi:ATP-dependent DNA helicase RecQ
MPSEAQAQATLALQGVEGIEDAGVDPRARVYNGLRDPDALLAHLGHRSFRPGQRDAVQAALGGRDSLIVMPTGGGKSLCYQLPGLASSNLTVVVSPLIALMADQCRRLTADGHPAAMIASAMGEERNRDVLTMVRDGHARIVYCSPERFASTSFLDALAAREVDLMAIDEAHCVSEWGHDFRPDYLRLPRAIERLGRPAVMACTATATEEVADEISQRLGLREPLVVRSGFDRPNISFDTVTFEGKGSIARKHAMLQHGLGQRENLPAIVYCGTRRDTEAVAEELRSAGLLAAAYHAGMEPDERASAQHRFMSGDVEVIVATNAFGMGIDKADVRSVWHWAIPTSVEAYYQEAGRAGRDGAPARAVLLAGRSDLGRLVRFNQQRSVEPEAILSYLRDLHRLADGDGSLVIENPRDDRDRIRLAIAERSGACSVEPAPGGRLHLELSDRLELRRAAAACRVAKDRGWRAYRAVEAFSFSSTCRRRSLLDHFGDRRAGRPLGRCCDVCDPDTGLPEAEALLAAPRRAARAEQNPPPELSPADSELLAELKAWRLRAAAGKPAYTVAHNRTLEAIAASRPGRLEALARIHGIGPAFLDRHGPEVLELIVAHGGPRALPPAELRH